MRLGVRTGRTIPHLGAEPLAQTPQPHGPAVSFTNRARAVPHRLANGTIHPHVAARRVTS